jgi:hypothetical protein
VKVALLAAMALSALMILTKLFTTVVWLADDPTVLLALRSRPALTNELLIRDEAELRGHHVLITDENGFVGEGVYAVVIGGGWQVGCAVLVGGAAVLIARRVRG